MLCYRPANQPTAIHPSLQIGIPAFIADKEDIFQLYFVTITPIPQVMTAPGKMQVQSLFNSSAIMTVWAEEVAGGQGSRGVKNDHDLLPVALAAR